MSGEEDAGSFMVGEGCQAAEKISQKGLPCPVIIMRSGDRD